MQTFQDFLHLVHSKVNLQTPITYDQWLKMTNLIDWADTFAKNQYLEGKVDALNQLLNKQEDKTL